MNIASKSTATPNRVEMLLEFIKSENKEYTKKELQELFSPQSDSVFKDNFSALDSLELITIENDVVKLNIEDKKLTSYQILKNSIFNDEFMYKDNFVYALSWLMIQDSSSIEKLEWSGQVNTLITKDLNNSFSELDLTSNPPWQNFYYWCKYLGFADKSFIGKNTYIMPDPTESISNELKFIFKETSELKINDFFRRLSLKIPVLEFGSARNKVLECVREGLSLSENQLSYATSLALLRLEERQVIKLEQKSDADSMTLKSLNNNKIISHILYLGK